MRILFVEPPKDFWFILGEYVPPPLGILTLASYLRAHDFESEIEVVDCQAERIEWKGLERRIEAFQPDLVAPSGLSTCNAYAVLRTAELAKRTVPNCRTVVGGQHFTALAQETLEEYSFVDFVVLGEGEETLVGLVKALENERSPFSVEGLAFRVQNGVVRTEARGLLCDLDRLPLPGYDFIRGHMKEYYFSLMAKKEHRFAIVEGSRGCSHSCSYCTQWRFWKGANRSKSPKRIATEFEHLHRDYGCRFFWLTDDNSSLGPRIDALCNEIIDRGISEDLTWFMQVRCDDIVRNEALLPKMRKAGVIWVLVGFDSPNPETLKAFGRKGVDTENAKKAVEMLRESGILCQGTFIIGERGDSHESIEALRDYADWLDPDIATFMALTPFPGTEIYEKAKKSGWIDDMNWSNYDMVHAIMPTESLSRMEVQEELYECYRSYYGSWKRRYAGLFSGNPIIRSTYQHLAKQALLTNLRSLF